jgi:polyhydroxybutyrate depolymerase
MRRLAAGAMAGLLALPAGNEGTRAESLQLTVRGQPRTFLVERPATRSPHPTIIMLHGLNGTAERVAQRTGLAQKGPQEGFAAVFPQSRATAWNRFSPGKEPPQAIEFFRPFGGPPNDIEFLESLVADLIRRGISDPGRMYLAGESNGGFMTLGMICETSANFAGIGLLITSMPEDLGAGCGALKSIPAFILSGTADTVVPYGGGIVAGSTFSVWSTDRLITFFRQRNGCEGQPGRSVVPGLQQRIEVEYSGPCRQAPIVVYRVVAGTHASTPVALPTGQLMVDFFRDKARTIAGSPARPQQALGSIDRVAYRRFDGATLVTGEIRRTALNSWLETNTRGSKWNFRTISEASSELVLHDAARDVYVRLDLTSKKMFVRQGATQDWRLLADIVDIGKN